MFRAARWVCRASAGVRALTHSRTHTLTAQVDATVNDTPAQIEGFPTLILFTAGDNTEVAFDGDRTAEAMAEFIRENGKAGKTEAAKEEL